MLLAAQVRESRRTPPDEGGNGLRGLDKLKAARSDVAAVTHVDYSARVQTVDAERHGRYAALLRVFEAKTGCPVLINTSFNVRGEPIVCAPEHAYRCFLTTNMDVLVLERFVLHNQVQPNTAGSTPAPISASSRSTDWRWPCWRSIGIRRLGSCAGSASCWPCSSRWPAVSCTDGWRPPWRRGRSGRRARPLAAIYAVAPPLRRWNYFGWLSAAFPIGWTLSHLALAATYYLVLTPIGVLLDRAAVGERRPAILPAVLTERPHRVEGVYANRQWIGDGKGSTRGQKRT